MARHRPAKLGARELWTITSSLIEPTPPPSLRGCRREMPYNHGTPFTGAAAREPRKLVCGRLRDSLESE